MGCTPARILLLLLLGPACSPLRDGPVGQPGDAASDRAPDRPADVPVPTMPPDAGTPDDSPPSDAPDAPATDGAAAAEVAAPPDATPRACGLCTAPMNAESYCEAGVCKWKCSTPWFQCPGTELCAYPGDATHCGPSCMECPKVEHGKPACKGDSCDFECDTGFYKCGNRCVGNDDAQACGASCTKCASSGMADTQPACVAGVCQQMCNAALVLCPENPACVPAVWDFENPLQAGWKIHYSDPPGGFTQEQAKSGRTSVVARLKFTATAEKRRAVVILAIDLCGQPANFQGRTLSAQVYIDGPDVVRGVGQNPEGGSTCLFAYGLNISTASSSTATAVQLKTWFQMTDKVPFKTSSTYTHINCWIEPKNLGPWEGSIYFDDVKTL